MIGASILMNLCSFGFNMTCSFRKIGIDIFRKLKHDSHELMIPLSSNMFFMPKTKSTFSQISDTNVNTSNLWSCMCITTGIMNNTPTYCSFPTCIICAFDVNFGNACYDLHLR